MNLREGRLSVNKGIKNLDRFPEEAVVVYRQTEERVYTVLVNHEEQYSIWFADRELPLGWREVGVRGTRDECLSHIEKTWTDIRPASLRRQLDEGHGT
jgi:MbtH protein